MDSKLKGVSHCTWLGTLLDFGPDGQVGYKADEMARRSEVPQTLS